MSMRMSIPVTTDTRFPSLPIWSQALRFRRLFFRNLWRSGVMPLLPLLPLVIALGVWFTLLNRRTGVVLWYDISLWLAMSYAVIGPLCAGLAAWGSGRSRRRRMNDQLDSVPMPGWQQDLMSFLTAGAIGALGYGGTVLIVLGWASTEATWGRPYGVVLVSGLVMVVLFSIVGAAIGMVWSHHLAALTALAITLGSVVFGASVQRGIGFSKGVRELTLWNTLNTLGHGGFNEWESRRNLPEISNVIVLATGLGALVIAATLLLRYRRMSFVVAVVATLFWTVAGSAMTTNGTLSPQLAFSEPPAVTASFSYNCSEHSGIELCLHPAWSGLEPEIADIITGFYGPVAGLEGVPTKLVQMDPRVQPHPTPDGATSLYLFQGDKYLVFQLTMGLRDQLFSNVEIGSEANDAQQVIAGWLMQRTGARPVFSLPWGMTADENTVAIAREQELQTAVDQFSVLSPEQQRTWLEANWDALRAGELTLDDLP